MKRTSRLVAIDEVELTPKEFIKFMRQNKGDTGSQPYIDKSRFVFSKRTIQPNETIEVTRGGKVYLSSYTQGIIQWDSKRKEYLEMYYGMETHIGGLRRVIIDAVEYDKIKEEANNKGEHDQLR